MFDWLIGAVGNWVKSWTAKPAKPKPTGKPTIPVTKNYGFQTTYNPQRTASTNYYQAPTYNPQRTASTRYYQPAATTRYVQNAYRPAPSYAQLAAQRAAERARQEAIARELERQRVIKVKTAEHQGRLSVFKNKFAGSISVAKNFMDKRAIAMAANKGHWTEYFTAKGTPWGGGKYDEKSASPAMRQAYSQMKSAFSLTDSIFNADGTINEKALAELEKAARNRFRVTAKELVDQRRKGSIFDEDAGRSFGWKSQADLQWRISSYENKLQSILAERGKREQAWREAQKAGNIELANRLADELNDFNSRSERNLIWHRAALQGLSKGYEAGASTPYRSTFANGIVHADNFVKKAVGGTIGGIFSAFEAPNRGFTTAAVKLSGAFGNKTHQVNTNDGKATSVPTNLSWGETYNKTKDARGLNMKNITMKSEDQFLREVYDKLKPSTPYEQWKREKGEAFYKDQHDKRLYGDWTANFMADPIMLLGKTKPVFQAGKILTGRGAGKIATTSAWKAASSSKVAQGVRWLGKEAMTPAQTAGRNIHERLTPFYASAKYQAGSIRRSFDTWKKNQTRFSQAIKKEREQYKGQLHKRFAKLDERVIYLAQNLVRQHQLGKSYKAMPWKAQLPVKKSIRGLPSLWKGEYPSVNMKGLTREQNKQALELRDWLLETSGSLYSRERGLGTRMADWYKGRGMYNRNTAKGLRYRRQEGYIANKAYGVPKRKNKDDPDFSISFLHKSKGGRFQNAERLSRSIANRFYQSKRWQNQYIDNPKFFAAMKDKSARFEETSNVINTVRKENVPTITNLWSNVFRGTGRWGKKSRRDKLGFTGNALRQDALPLPRRAWTAAVLPLRGAWYVNNAAYGQMAGLMAAGPRFLLEQAKLMRPGAIKAARDADPQLVSSIGKYNQGGRLYRPAKLLEDWQRYATFNARKNQGFSSNQAKKDVDNWLINYDMKNWERPFKSVMPFWAWTKGIGKATARMPFDRPLAAQTFSSYDKTTTREKNKLPEDQRKYYPGSYVGKDDVGNPQFNNLPWLPWTQNNIKSVGLNPLISAASEWAQNKDRYGNKLGPKSMGGALADRFPQVGLYNDFKNGAKTVIKSFSQRGSDGYALTKQDVKDTTGDFSKSLASYMGFSETKTFDRNDYNRRQKERQFYDEWFARDWKTEFKDDWQGQVNAQTALAKKYGFSLDHVYDNLFRKRDTPTTTAIKDKKDEARKWADKFWDDYQKQPYGTRSRWANEKMKEVIDSKIIESNTFINDKLPKWYSAENSIKYSKPSTAVQYKGKWFKSVDSLARYKRYEQYRSTGYWKDGKRFKSAESYERYQRYLAYQRGDYNSNRTGKRESPYQYEGKYFNSAETMEKYKEGSFWKKYYATSDYQERQKMLDANPQYRSFDMPETAAEWREFKRLNKQRQFERASQLPDWMAAYENYKELAPKRVKFAPTKKIVWKG